MGEGLSYGPLNDRLKDELKNVFRNRNYDYEISWTTLGEFLTNLEQKQISPNVASFVGASTLRKYVVGDRNRPPTEDELQQMQQLTAGAMEEGALGLSSALVYPPASFANTDELIALAGVASRYGGLYISHIRSESAEILSALEELITIARQVRIRAEIYHIKIMRESNWGLMDKVIASVEAARKEGLDITADMYPYNASSTGLKSILPDWIQEGSNADLIARLRNPDIRQRLKDEIHPAGSLKNRIKNISVDNILLASFGNPDMVGMIGKSLAEAMILRGTSAEDTLIDILVEDNAHTLAIYFAQSEENIRKVIQLPWVSFCSDGESIAPEGIFLKSNPHPRYYGSFARILGKYTRDEKLIPLTEAIRRLTSFPATNLRLKERGALLPGYFADLVVFDPQTIMDLATYEQPHRYARGVSHVFVNGVQVIREGEHTGAKPGKFLHGPGYQASIKQ
jgi:N-acyl-D-amino-acid deacylase